MTLKAARSANLLLAGMPTGNEFGSRIAVHPAPYELPPQTHVQTEQAITRGYGKVMPAFMTSTILSFIPVLALMWERKSPSFRFTLAGMLCFVTMLIVTLTSNIPINQRVLELSSEAPLQEFLELRGRWNRLHTVWNLLNLIGLSLSLLGALSSTSER